MLVCQICLLASVIEDISERSAADVTLRRIQRFNIEAGRKISWALTRNGKVCQGGETIAGTDGHLTLPALTVSATPAQLTLR